MYLKQRGLLPALTTFGGFSFFLLSIYWFFHYLIFWIKDYSHPSRDLGGLLLEIVIFLTFTLLLISPLVLISGFLLNLFPEIRLTGEGIRYRSWILSKGSLKWEEIDNLIELRTGTIAIVINRKGFPLTNGLYFLGLNGQLIKHEYAVLFISQRMEQRQALIQEILTQAHLDKVKTVKDLYT